MGVRRWWFSIKQAWVHRAELKQFLTDPNKQIHSLEEITPERLDAAHIAILVLDFDGVLAPHDDARPIPSAEQCLRKLSQNIGEQRIAIFTNKPKPERIQYFTQNFPSIFVVQGVAKKPFPDGLLQIAEYKGVPPHRLALIDDRLLTGILATCLAYTQAFYLYPPKQNFLRNPIRESLFSLLRLLERGILKIL